MNKKFKSIISVVGMILVAILLYQGIKTFIELDPLAQRFSGTVSLPAGEVAFEDTLIEVACVRLSDEIPETQLVVLSKGQSVAPFKVKVPKDDSGYYLRYMIYPKGGEGSKDAVAFSNSTQYSNLGIGGLSIMNHVYVKEAYISSDGMTIDGTNKKVFQKNNLEGQDFKIVKEAGLQEKTDEILKTLNLDNLTDLQKEKVIYDFVISYLPITEKAINDLLGNVTQEYNNPLKSALMDQQSVWLGHPFLVKWLLYNANVKSELVEAHIKDFNMTKVFNLVHINQNSYFLDTLKASQMINDQVMMDGEFVFKNQDMAKAYFTNRYFNFTGDFLLNLKLRENTESGVPSNASHGAGFGLIDEFLKANSQTVSQSDVVHIRGQVVLPKGVEAPEYGLYVQILITSGKETLDKTDDYISSDYILIPQGQRAGKFETDFINTKTPVTMSVKDFQAGLHARVKLEANGKSEIDLSVEINR